MGSDPHKMVERRKIKKVSLAAIQILFIILSVSLAMVSCFNNEDDENKPDNSENKDNTANINYIKPDEKELITPNGYKWRGKGSVKYKGLRFNSDKTVQSSSAGGALSWSYDENEGTLSIGDEDEYKILKLDKTLLSLSNISTSRTCSYELVMVLDYKKTDFEGVWLYEDGLGEGVLTLMQDGTFEQSGNEVEEIGRWRIEDGSRLILGRQRYRIIDLGKTTVKLENESDDSSLTLEKYIP